MPSDSFQESSFRRKLSKREKKQMKKQEKLNRLKSSGDADEGSVAEKLYTGTMDKVLSDTRLMLTEE